MAACWRFWFYLITVTILRPFTPTSTQNVSSVESLFGPGACPGLEGNISSGSYQLRCSQSCQEATCTALRKFFYSTYIVTTPFLKPWRKRKGWEAFLNRNCTQILATPAAGGMPAYCSWHGITCCHSLFRKYCNVTNSLAELKIEVNGLNGSVENPTFQQSIGQLHACGMLSLELAGNALSGSMDDSWGKLTNLRLLNLGKNMVEGTIPASMQQLDKLLVLNLDGNPMHGTVSTWLSKLRSLRALGLSAFTGRNADGKKGLVGTIPASLGRLRDLQLLSLDTNSLTGPFPPQLCHQNISALILRSNQLSWSMRDLQGCTQIVYIDFSRNRYRGTLPDNYFSWNFADLLWLNLHSNGIKGTLPMALFGLERIGTLNLANNRLTGTIDGAVSQMPFLIRLDLHGNKLTGTIDESLWYMPRLHSIDLSGNQLTGSIDSAIAFSYYLTNVRLSNNQLTGRIPQEVAVLPFLESMHLSNNTFSCMGTASVNSTGPDACSNAEQVLPCFLRLTEYTVPRSDASNMECPDVIRKPRSNIIADCAGSGAVGLGNMMESLPESDLQTQAWYLDPSYYQYQGCSCLGGYMEVWDSNHTVLTCEVAQPEEPTFLIPLTAVLVTVFVLMLAAISMIVWLKLTVQLRRKWQREKELKSNRMKGVPKGGPVAIVVTDIEKYSELMQLNAATTVRALGMHNAILRKAATTHAGHVIEQEGDSWSLAFHRSVDAVAFCLQVQQALQRNHWPLELLEMTSTRTAEPRRSGSAAAASSHSSHMTLWLDRKQSGVSSQSSKSLAAGPSTAHPLHEVEDGSASMSSRSRSLNSPLNSPLSCRMRSTMQSLVSRSSSASTTKRYATAHSNLSTHDTAVVELSSHSDDLQSSTPPSQPRRAASTRSAPTNIRGGSLTSRSKGSASFSKIKPKAPDEVITGLRVRMGIASGCLPSDSDINTSAVFALAKAVSDMANGGQILLESRTADAVRDWLSDLGCVDHKGYNDKLLSSPLTHNDDRDHGVVTRWLLRLMGCFSAMSAERDPELLDLGQYWVPSLASTIRAVSAATGGTQTTSNMQHQSRGRHQTDVLQAVNARLQKLKDATTEVLQPTSSKACVAVAANALMYGQKVNGISAAESINLYSIVAQPLQARSQIWKNELNLKEETQQLSRGYFDASGTAPSNVASARFLDAGDPMSPSVTVVFAAVEGGRQLVRRNEHVAKLIHNVISRVMQAVLLSLPDGYMCHEQEAVLKYMVAFKEPARAAEWCLLVQAVLHDIPWPHEVMAAVSSKGSPPWSPTAARRSAQTAADATKRPGLKMGLAEGVPDSIAPDHLGRADYFGTSVNLAARIMDAAADAGQVTMSCDLADIIFSVWRYEAEVKTQRQRSGTAQGRTISEAAASNPAHLTGHQSPRQQAEGCSELSAAAAERASSCSISICASHVGTYAFKGCGEVEVVCLTSDAVAGSIVAPPMSFKSSKGTLVAATSGPVMGMQNCRVDLPNILQEFQDIWGLVADQVADAHYLAVLAHRSPNQQSPRSPPRSRWQSTSR